MSHSSSPIPNSSSLSSHLCMPIALLLVSKSMAALYSLAESNILKVEFHHVLTSCGNVFLLSFSFFKMSNQFGNCFVIECRVEEAIFLSWWEYIQLSFIHDIPYHSP